MPVNMLERVEIYKGAMPLYLAADALGGGINFVSRREYKNFAEFSYAGGSFNTHRVTANALWKTKNTTWYLGGRGSLNYSDKHYIVRVHFPTSQTIGRVLGRDRVCRTVKNTEGDTSKKKKTK